MYHSNYDTREGFPYPVEMCTSSWDFAKLDHCGRGHYFPLALETYRDKSGGQFGGHFCYC